MNYSDAIIQLQSYVLRRGVCYDLDRLGPILARLGHPEKYLPPLIHIAGTNGKGSVLTFLASALHGAGYRVGTYTSPHVHSYCERIQLALSPISEADFAALFEQVQSAMIQEPIQNLTEFEILTLMAFLFFREHTLDYVILETGLGGRLDATNVCQPIVSLITPIGMDHQDILGSNLADIAREKAGIIKPGIPVLSAVQLPDAAEVLRRTAQHCDAPLTFVSPDSVMPASYRMRAAYQCQNVALVRAALQLLFPDITEAVWEPGLSMAEIPGRYTRMERDNRVIIVDGAHNPHGVDALLRCIKTDYPLVPLTVVFGALKRKNARTMAQQLAAYASVFYVCDFDPGNSVSVSDCQSWDLPLSVQAFDLRNALPSDDLVLVTGSLYFITHFLV